MKDIEVSTIYEFESLSEAITTANKIAEMFGLPVKIQNGLNELLLN